jgi:hypothetical protein
MSCKNPAQNKKVTRNLATQKVSFQELLFHPSAVSFAVNI